MKYDYKNRAGYKKDHIHEISGLPISICLRKINVITGFEKYLIYTTQLIEIWSKDSSNLIKSRLKFSLRCHRSSS